MKIQQNNVREIPIEKIIIPDFAKRKWENPKKFHNLCASVKTQGVLIPVTVRKKGARFELLKGNRRYAASAKAKLKTIPAIVSEMNDKNALFLRLACQNQEKMSIFDQAIAIVILAKNHAITLKEIADKIGRSTSHISNCINLATLSDYVQENVFFERINLEQAYAIAERKFTAEKQKECVDMIIQHGLSSKEFAAKIRNAHGKEKISRHIRNSSGKSIEARLQDILDVIQAVADNMNAFNLAEATAIRKKAGKIKKVIDKIITSAEKLKAGAA